MPRRKLSEYRAKTIVSKAIGMPYVGLEIDAKAHWQKNVQALSGDETYVVKVDQAVKGRFKKGLVKLDRPKQQLAKDIKELSSKGFEYFIVEPYAKHDSGDEMYVALARTKDGIDVSYSSKGGIDVESDPDAIKHVMYREGLDLPSLGLNKVMLQKIVEVFEDNFFSFLEINPLLVHDGVPAFLDMAVEVDDAADFFVDGRWATKDLRSYNVRALTKQEEIVKVLADQSQASFSLEVINPDASVFLLLSGGGASVVVADEVSNIGLGKELGNYGEYSGNPNREETAHYTTQVLELLLNSKAKHKVLIIGGGVANFTDVRATFAGVIDALKKYQTKLKQQGIKVYVRRGGPHETEGLKAMKEYLEQAGLLGYVTGPDMVLTDIVKLATEELKT
jgi:succinyl-CoA synthetase beta subunit